jgi:hypothetical protein
VTDSTPATAAALVPLRAVALALATADSTIHQEPPYCDTCSRCEAAVELRRLLTDEQWESLWT